MVRTFSVMSLPEFSAVKHPQYRTIHVNGIFGGVRMGYMEAVVYSEESELTKALGSMQINANRAEVNRVLECRLVIDPIQLKSIAIWMNKQVEDYEKIFGRIPSPEEVANKQKTSKDQ